MPRWMQPTKIRKVVFESRDSHELNAIFKRETAVEWTFEPPQSEIHMRGDIALIGDVLIATIESETGYNWICNQSARPNLKIIFVQAGKLSGKTNETFMLLEDGDVRLSIGQWRPEFAVKANTVFTIVFAPVAKCLRFISHKNDPYAFLSTFNQGLSREHPIAQVILAIARTLQAPKELNNPFSYAPMGAAILKEALFQTLLCDWPRSNNGSIRRGAKSRYIRRSLEWINLHLNEKITLHGIAEAAGASTRTLQGQFTREVGMSPMAYVIGTRLRHVHAELIDGDNHSPISMIATKYGFHSYSEFERHFKRRYGQTPSEIRRASRLAARS